MLKLGKMTDYGIVIMTALAVRPDSVQSTSELSLSTRLSPPTVRKLMKLLARSGLVDAVRGVQGGYRLKRVPEQITITHIIDALEGPVTLTECAGNHSHCVLESQCSIRDHWQPINLAVQRALSAVSLAQMAVPLGEPAGDWLPVRDFARSGPRAAVSPRTHSIGRP